MKQQDKWLTNFLNSEAAFLNGVEKYLYFLISFLEIVVASNDEKLSNIDVQILSSLSLIDKMHMYYVYRKNFIAQNQQVVACELIHHSGIEKCMSKLHRTINNSSFLTNKEQCKRIVHQIMMYYPQFIHVIIDSDSVPSLPWFENNKLNIWMKEGA